MANALERWFEGRRMSPFRDLSQIQDSFERMMNELMNLRRPEGLTDFGFSPACEISEEGNSYVLKFDLPGVTKEQVRVEADNDQLTIHAERREEKSSESRTRYLSELYYGAFSRSFTLPGPIDEKKINARFDNGVLTVTVPKTESAKAKLIPIH